MDNHTDRNQVSDLVLKDPETGDDMVIVSTLRSGPGGFMSFDAQSAPDAAKWRVELRITEIK